MKPKHLIIPFLATFLAATCTPDYEAGAENAVAPSYETAQEYAAYASGADDCRRPGQTCFCRFINQPKERPEDEVAAVAGFVRVDTSIPHPRPVHFVALHRSPGLEEEDSVYPHTLRAECDFEGTGAVAWLRLVEDLSEGPNHPSVRHFYFHKREDVEHGWFFTYWYNDYFGDRLAFIAELWTGNKYELEEDDVERRRGTRNDWLQFRVMQDYNNRYPTYWCPAGHFAEEGDLRNLADFCLIPSGGIGKHRSRGQ